MEQHPRETVDGGRREGPQLLPTTAGVWGLQKPPTVLRQPPGEDPNSWWGSLTLFGRPLAHSGSM